MPAEFKKGESVFIKILIKHITAYTQSDEDWPEYSTWAQTVYNFIQNNALRFAKIRKQ